MKNHRRFIIWAKVSCFMSILPILPHCLVYPHLSSDQHGFAFFLAVFYGFCIMLTAWTYGVNPIWSWINYLLAGVFLFFQMVSSLRGTLFESGYPDTDRMSMSALVLLGSLVLSLVVLWLRMAFGAAAKQRRGQPIATAEPGADVTIPMNYHRAAHLVATSGGTCYFTFVVFLAPGPWYIRLLFGLALLMLIRSLLRMVILVWVGMQLRFSVDGFYLDSESGTLRLKWKHIQEVSVLKAYRSIHAGVRLTDLEEAMADEFLTEFAYQEPVSLPLRAVSWTYIWLALASQYLLSFRPWRGTLVQSDSARQAGTVQLSAEARRSLQFIRLAWARSFRKYGYHYLVVPFYTLPTEQLVQQLKAWRAAYGPQED